MAQAATYRRGLEMAAGNELDQDVYEWNRKGQNFDEENGFWIKKR